MVRLIAAFFVLAAAPVAIAQTPSGSSPINADPSGDLLFRTQRACAINCVYLFLRHLGCDVTYQQLAPALLKNEMASLKDLRDACQGRGVPVRMLKLNRDSLSTIEFPAILHLERVRPSGESRGHFVLAVRLEENGVRCIDGTTAAPALMEWLEFERDWTGYTLARASGSMSVVAASAACLLGVAFGLIIAAHRRAHPRRSPVPVAGAQLPSANGVRSETLDEAVVELENSNAPSMRVGGVS